MFYGTIYLNGGHLYNLPMSLSNKKGTSTTWEEHEEKEGIEDEEGPEVLPLGEDADKASQHSQLLLLTTQVLLQACTVHTCWITSAPTNPNCFNRKDIQISITLLLQAENITWIWKLSLTQLSFLPLEWYMVLHNNCVFAPFSTEKDAYNVNQMLLRGLFGEIWQISRLIANNRISITRK